MVTWQLFPQACTFTSVASVSCWLFNTCCSVQSLVVPIGRMVFLLIQIYNSLRVLYLVNQLTTLERVCTATCWKLCWFCLLWRLTLTFSCCFTVFQFKAEIFEFCERQVSCVSLALSVSMAAQIEYQIWVLKEISTVEQDLDCETVFKHKQKSLFNQPWLDTTKVTN